MTKKLLPSILFFALYLFSVLDGKAQVDSSRVIYDEEPNFGLSAYTQLNHVFYKPEFGELVIGFQYNIDGRPGVFTDTITGLKKGAGTYPVFGIEIYHKNISLDVNFCPFYMLSTASKWNAYAGLTYRFRYEKYFPSMAENELLSAFPVSFTLGVTNYNAIWRAGRIRLDTTERFNAFGGSLGLTEDEPEHGFVNVLFQERIFAFTPSINLGYKPLYQNFEVSLRFGPFIPFYSKSGVNFLYRDSDLDDKSFFPKGSSIPMRGYGIHATYNGGEVPENPFPIKGWMLCLRVSFGGSDVFRHVGVGNRY